MNVCAGSDGVISNITTMPTPKFAPSISYFDVNNEECILLAYSTQKGLHWINVFDEAGMYIGGFSFNCSGSYITAFSERDKHILLYSYRENMLYELGIDGFVYAKSLSNDNTARQILSRDKQIIVNNSCYSYVCRLFSSNTYDIEIFKEDFEGKKDTIISYSYKKSNDWLIPTAYTIAVIAVLSLIIVSYRSISKHKKFK